ncbi:MAG: hypothetical protein JEZ07_01395 [Phycisphaerae bacterium]|nr:hypothetical protein [Phycisphaerae bacterium]
MQTLYTYVTPRPTFSRKQAATTPEQSPTNDPYVSSVQLQAGGVNYFDVGVFLLVFTLQKGSFCV